MIEYMMSSVRSVISDNDVYKIKFTLTACTRKAVCLSVAISCSITLGDI